MTTLVKVKKKKDFSKNEISVATDLFLKIVFGIVVFATCIYPLLMIIASSFTENIVLLHDGYSVIPRKVTLEAYEFVLVRSGQLARSYMVTILNTSVGTVVGVFMMSTFAYAVSRKDLKYANFFSLFAYVTFVFNGGLVPFYFVYSRVLGLSNTYWVMIIPYLVDVWYIVILKTYFANSIPHEVFERRNNRWRW